MVTQPRQATRSSRYDVPRFRTSLRPLAAALMVALCNNAFALPTDPTIVSGQAAVNAAGTTGLVVNQSSAKAAIDWRTFSVGSNETVRFNQPSTAAVTVNRVTTNDPSQILGKISALGSVFLINPSGIIFGRDAVVDVGSLVASTLTASSADLLSGRYVFGVAPGGSGRVRNEGRITAAEGGSVTLIGTRVSNTGTIVTPGGSTGLIAGERVNIDFDGDGLVRYQVDAGAVPTLVENAGQIIADGGRVALQAGTRDALLDTVLNVDGVVRARSISRRNGEIYLDGGGSGVVQVSGTLDASGTAAGVGGGRVRVLGESVGLFGSAHIDASGETGGGTVLIGGNYQGGGAEHNATRSYVGSGASISADATGSGDGGKVIVWADDWTRFYGSIRARGGTLGGDGGFVEVSGKRNLAFSGNVNTGAVLGRAGMLLLDPENLNVVSGEAPAPAVTADPAGVFRAPSVGDDITYYVSASSLDGASDYTLQAPGTVTFATSVAFNGVASNIISVTGGTGIIFAGGSTVSTKGAALSLTAPDMTLGAITTNVGSPAGGNLKIDASGTVTQLAAFTLGAGSLIKQGTGTLNLSQTNTYTGSTTVNAGTITVSNAAGLGFSAVQVDSGATLYIDGVTIAPSSINIAGSGVDGTGALTGTGAASYSGSLVLSGAAAVGATAGSTLTLGAINGGVGDSLIKLGDGTVVLGGPASYSGGTTIGAGVLTAGNATALGPAGTVTVTSGGTLNIADGITLAAGTPISLSGTLRGTGNAVYDGTVTLAAATARIDTPIASDTLTLRAAMDGSSALTKIGAGTLKLSGANSYSGSTAINGGTVLLNSSSTLPDLTVVSFSGAGSKLELNGTNQHIGSLGGSGTIQLGTGTLRVTQNVDNTFSGTIAGAGNLTKDGPATLTLTSAGGYAGTTRVTGGMLTLQGAGSLGGGAATVDNGATLHLDGVSLTSPSSINLAGAGWNDGTHSYGALWGTGAAGYTGELALTSPATIHVGPFSGASTDRLTLTAGSGGTVISGGISRNLTKTGLGTLEISTGSASFGDMAIQAGTLSIRSDALGVGDVSVASGATLNINNTALHTPRSIQLSGNGLGGAGALTGTGTAGYTGAIALPAATSIGVSAGSMFTLNTNRSGAGNLTKVGAGTLVLGGSAAAHSGTTAIADGILTAVSNSAFGPGSVAVDSGATLNIADGITLAAVTPISLSGTLRGTGNAVYDGTVTLAAATARIDTPIASDTLMLGAAMDGSSALTKIGAGTLKLSGANSYSGSTAINGGTVLLNSSSTLPDLTVVSFSGAGSKLELNGTNQHIGSLGGSGTIQLGTGTLRVTQNVDNTFSGTIAGAGNLTKDGPATLTLTSAGGYAGTTRVTGGMLTLQGAGSLGGGAATVDNGATLHLDGVSLTSPSSINLAGAGWNDGTHSYGALWGTGAAGYTGELALTSPATIHVGPFSGASTDRLTLTAGSGGTVISGGISRNLTKTGLGTLEISTGSASFGDMAIQAGTLSVRSDALGVGDVSVASGATLNINNTALHTPRSIQLSGNGLGGAGALTGTGTAGYTGAIALPAATSIGVSAGSILTLNANRSGAGNLTKVGGGTLVLGGSAATHSGTTTIAAGILTAVSNSAFGPGSVAVDSGATLNIADGVTLGSPSSINLAGSGVVIAGRSVGALMGTGAASYSGGVRLASDAEITAAAGGTLTLNGTVNGATRALTIDGPGTVTLAAGANGLSSVTQLAGSTLNLGASQSIVTSGVQTYLGTLRGANATLRSTGGGAVSAAGSANHFTGTLTLDTTGPASLAGHFGSLNAHTGALSLGATTVDSNAAIIASGTIGQTAALVVGGTTTLDAGANAITLGNAGNDFGGAVSATG
ncbi:autotransporter-associated beta strand repeat-containing protein, partial [Zoogloea sp. 1C4]|uniref:autotransporter-associated beta strand repeat-containing protein n=1 Tax=Zoogloea sp. 1C4 TaxID=2570190 RepID=UPI0012917E70